MRSRCVLLSCSALLLIVFIFSLASVAHASGFWYYAYYGSEGNCWQTGQLGSASSKCDNIGPGFLEVPGRLATDSTSAGIGEDIQRTPSGDYCSYYGLDDAINKQDPNNESGATGEGVPSPFSSYQEWDGNGNVCQANLNRFGEEIHSSSCSTKTCGMHHYVSFREQGYKNRPWGKSFGNPSLVISTEATVQTFSTTSPAGWGYVCPILQDVQPPHNILEYCVEEWRGSGNAKPEWEDERIGTCAGGPETNNIDTVISFLYPGTQFVTEGSGSSNTEVAKAGWRTYKFSITAADLEHAIALDRTSYVHKAGSGSGESTPELGHGCGREHELSTNAAEYALIGIEQGAEAWSFSELGASEANLEVHDEYTPVAPNEVTTGSESGIGYESATVNGSGNPEGQPTNFRFVYQAEGESTPTSTQAEPEWGYGIEPVTVHTTLTGLKPSTTYHWWIEAESSAGTRIGETKTFKTLPPPRPKLTLGGATEVQEKQATVNGTVNPEGFDTHYFVEYGTTGAFGSVVPAEPGEDAGAGTSAVTVHVTLTGLTPGTTYYWQLVAKNTWGRDLYSGEAEYFTTVHYQGEPCGGDDIAGQGAAAEKLAQIDVWTPDFNTSTSSLACSGKQGTKGKPTVTYTADSSGKGIASWGIESKEPAEVSFGPSNAFIGTLEAPNTTQKGEATAHASLPEDETLYTVPVAQFGLAVYVHLPAGCTATSTPAEGRLALSDATLQGIYAGTITKWGQITEGGDTITGNGCSEAAIVPVVRKEKAGTTDVLKKFLDEINGASLSTAKGSKTWNQLSEGSLNTTWPSALSVVAPSSEGDAAEAEKVAATPGSIGYSNLAELRATGLFSPATPTKFWVELEKSTKGAGSYADPSTDGDTASVANANCKSTIYVNGSNGSAGGFPPPSVGSPWNEVRSELTSKTYPLCSLLYILAFKEYHLLPGTAEAEAATVQNFLSFVTSGASTSGSKLIGENHDYASSPAELLLEAEEGASKIRF